MTNVLITGGNGLVGSHLAERLMDRGDTVTLYDLDFTTNTRDIECEKLQGDILDYPTLASSIDGMDAVFHFAAVSRVAWGQENPRKCWQTNILGTLNVLEACRRAATRPVVFYASSREVYGEPRYFPVDEAHPKDPKSIYGMSKLYAEHACEYYFTHFQLDGLIFRFSNVYGSERDQLLRVIPKFMLNALRGRELTLYGGTQVLDFTFIDDTVAGVYAAYTQSLENRDLLGEAFHFVTGRGVSVAELAAMIVAVAESSSRIVSIDAKGFDVLKFVGDPSKARELLGYAPTVPLETGLTVLKERLASTRMDKEP